MFFNKRQKVLRDYMTFKNKVSPDILALQIAKNTGIIATSLDHNSFWWMPLRSNYRKQILGVGSLLASRNTQKTSRMFTKKCALLRKNEELSKHAIRAVNSIIKKKTQRSQ